MILLALISSFFSFPFFCPFSFFFFFVLLLFILVLLSDVDYLDKLRSDLSLLSARAGEGLPGFGEESGWDGSDFLPAVSTGIPLAALSSTQPTKQGQYIKQKMADGPKQNVPCLLSLDEQEVRHTQILTCTIEMGWE